VFIRTFLNQKTFTGEEAKLKDIK